MLHPIEEIRIAVNFFSRIPLIKYMYFSPPLQLSHYTSCIYTSFLPQIRILVINFIIYLSSSYLPWKMPEKPRMFKNRYTSIVYMYVKGRNPPIFFRGGGGRWPSARHIRMYSHLGLRNEGREGL